MGKKEDDPINVTRQLDFAFLFVVDIINQSSCLLVAGGRELALAREAFPDGEVCEAVPGIVPPGTTIKGT